MTAWGATLRRLRADAGMTQMQLANRTGVALGTVRLHEEGKTRGPTLAQMEWFAVALHVRLQKLVGIYVEEKRKLK